MLLHIKSKFFNKLSKINTYETSSLKAVLFQGDITALLSAACLLAKFLGYITFQPYQQTHQFPAALCESSHESVFHNTITNL